MSRTLIRYCPSVILWPWESNCVAQLCLQVLAFLAILALVLVLATDDMSLLALALEPNYVSVLVLVLAPYNMSVIALVLAYTNMSVHTIALVFALGCTTW